MKGLPLAYAKDMQEDKEVTFDALKALRLALFALTGMLEDLKPNVAAMAAAAQAGFSTATDLADWLVANLKLPFREAHHLTGRLVAAAESSGVSLDKLPLEVMQEMHPGITEAVFSVLSVRNSLRSRASYGGTAPQNVRKMARSWIKRLERAAGKG
jgi:argininosuccinate lyase